MSRCGPRTFEMAFDATNPEAVRWAETRAARLIVEVGRETRRAVREIVSRAFSEGIPPREAARLIKDVVGLTSRQAGAVAGLRARLAAKGVRAAEVQRRTSRYASRLRRRRALTIARTETMAAANEGQRQLWLQAKASGYLSDQDRRRWVVTPDERLCEVCAPMRRATAPLAADTWTKVDGTVVTLPLPAHPNCRCTHVIELARPKARAAEAVQ